jgi:threonine dehydrogenase-like Zn-dependent dehydrogenase
MKAIAMFPKEKVVRLVDHPEPRISRPTEVKIRMLEIGICGTDREICSFQYGTPPAGSDYLVLGHESLGEVIEVGSGVTRVSPGDLVVTMVRRPCPHAHCPACRATRQDFCLTGDYRERGIKESHGFIAEFVVDDEQYMIIVPQELRDVGVLVEPITVVAKALTEAWKIQQRLPWVATTVLRAGVARGQKAVVLGAGPVGLLGAMGMRALGFETFVYSRSTAPNPKAALAEALGAKYISSKTTTINQLIEIVGEVGVVLEAVGASKIAFDVMRVLRGNGVFVFTGVPGQRGPVEVDADLIMRNLVLKNNVVFGSVNASRENFESAVRFLGDFVHFWPDVVRGLITGRFSIEEAPRLLTGRASGIKEVVVLGGQ